MANYYYAASDENVRMQNLYLFPGGGSLQLSKSRGYYAEKTEQNQNGYESGEEALRRLELREDWSAAVNSAIGGGAKPSSADGNAAYPLSGLDKNDDGDKDDGSSGGNNGDAGDDGGEPQPTPDNDKSESESGKNDVLPSLAIFLPISALIVLPFIIAAVKSIRKKR